MDDVSVSEPKSDDLYRFYDTPADVQRAKKQMAVVREQCSKIAIEVTTELEGRGAQQYAAIRSVLGMAIAERIRKSR